jgi:hypothetical protein
MSVINWRVWLKEDLAEVVDAIEMVCSENARKTFSGWCETDLDIDGCAFHAFYTLCALGV